MVKVIEPNNENIYFIGRWADKIHNGVRIMASLWVGGNFRFRFSGTSCTVKIVPPSSGAITSSDFIPQLAYSIDGNPFIRRNADSDLTLTGMANTTHTLEVWFVGAQHSVDRWSYDEGLMFSGLLLEDNSILEPYSDWFRGRAMFIGDSITEGAWALTKEMGDNVTLPRNTDAIYSYPQMFGRYAGFEVYNCGLNGWGLSTKSGFPTPDIAMGYSAKDVPQNDPKMDMIFIALGHNHTYDYSMSDAVFESEYTKLVNKMKQLHPESKIYCLALFSPIWGDMGGGIGWHRNTSIQRVSGTLGTTYIDCGLMPSDYLSIGGHPDPKDAKNMAVWIMDKVTEDIHVLNKSARQLPNSRILNKSR